MSISAPKNEITRWLNQKENLALLQKIAGYALKEIQTRHFEHYLCLDIGNDDKQEAINEIVALLIIFIQEKKAIQNILLCGEPSMANQVKRSFINHLIDQIRKKDFYRKLHRNSQAAIRKSDLFQSKREPHTGFCFFQDRSSSPQRVLLTDEDIREIPFPRGISPETDYKAVNRKHILSQLASYFADQVKQLTGTDNPLIEMNIFVKWISFYTVLSFQFESMDDSRKEHLERKLENCQGELKDNKSALARQEEAEVLQCVEAFVNRLEATEQQVFFLFNCQNLDHRQVQQVMKKKSPLSYQKKKGEKILGELLAPFSPKVVEEIFTQFLKQVCQLLEKKEANRQ